MLFSDKIKEFLYFLYKLQYTVVFILVFIKLYLQAIFNYTQPLLNPSGDANAIVFLIISAFVIWEFILSREDKLAISKKWEKIKTDIHTTNNKEEKDLQK